MQWNFHSNPFFGGENDLNTSRDLGNAQAKGQQDDGMPLLQVTSKNTGLAEEVIKLEGMLSASIEREKTLVKTLEQMKGFAEHSNQDAKSSLEKADAAQK